MSDASTRQSLSRSSPKTFPPLRTPRAPRVPPSPTSNSKTSGAGAGNQLRLKQYKVSRSTPVQDAKIPSEGNLRSTKVLRKVGGAAEAPPASPQEGLATLPSAVDIVCICPRRLLQSAETTTICHNMHLTQDPHVESTHKTRYHQKPSSGAVRRRYETARRFAGRRTPLARLKKTYTEVCLNHRRSRYKTAKHARSRPHSNVRQAWIVSGAINISTRTYITHHQQGLSAAAAWDNPRHVLFTPCQHR